MDSLTAAIAAGVQQRAVVIPAVGVSAFEAVAMIGTWPCQVESPGTMYPSPREGGGFYYAAAAEPFYPGLAHQFRVFPDPVPLCCFARSGTVHFRLSLAARIFFDVREDLLFGRRSAGPQVPVLERCSYGPASRDDPLLMGIRRNLAAMVAGDPRPGCPGYRCPALTHQASSQLANAVRTIANASPQGVTLAPINFGSVMALRSADGEPVRDGEMLPGPDDGWLGYPDRGGPTAASPYSSELYQCADDIGESVNCIDDVEGCNTRLRVEALEGFARAVGDWFRTWREGGALFEDANLSSDDAIDPPSGGVAARGRDGPY